MTNCQVFYPEMKSCDKNSYIFIFKPLDPDQRRKKDPVCNTNFNEKETEKKKEVLKKREREKE